MERKSKIDMSGLNEKHVQILWQTMYDILSEKGKLGNYQIVVKNTRKKWKVGVTNEKTKIRQKQNLQFYRTSYNKNNRIFIIRNRLIFYSIIYIRKLYNSL